MGCTFWAFEFHHFFALTYNKDMVLSLPNIKVLKQHVCEGSILGKTQQVSFPRDGFMRINHKLYLVHIGVCGLMRKLLFGKYL